MTNGWVGVLQRVLDLLIKREGRPLSLRLILLGTPVFTLGVALSYMDRWSLVVSIKHFVIGVSQQPPDSLVAGVVGLLALLLGAALMLVGLCFAIQDRRESAAQRERQRTLVIQQLSRTPGPIPWLIDELPADQYPQRSPITHDIRDLFHDGRIQDPESCLALVSDVGVQASQVAKDTSPQDFTVLYGGVMAAPFTFLTGALLGSTTRMHLFDWDREALRWRPVTGDEPDDGARFVVDGLDDVAGTTGEIVVVAEVSHAADGRNLASSFPGLPVVFLRLPELGYNAHWSLHKQSALSGQLLQTMKALDTASHIHLILPAPNSVVFTFGRLFDPNQRADTTVYHFEFGNSSPYPWGIRLGRPALGRPPSVVHRSVPIVSFHS